MLSFWEKQDFLQYDYIIIGAGITGLSTALSIRESAPHATILVLERGLIPTGASTKNAGFACIGSLTEIIEDLKTMSETEVLQLVEWRMKGLQKLRRRLGDDAIRYASHGSYELISEHELTALDHFYEINDLLRPVIGADAFSRADHMIGGFGFDKGFVKHILRNSQEGELDAGKMMKALLGACMGQQIEVKTGAEVVRVLEENNGVKIFIEHKHLGQHITFSCTRLAVCTNAFTNSIIPGLDLHPGRGQVLVTRPIEGLKVKGIFHFDRGYYYFREVEGRILFGGGRNMDFEKERTEELSYNEIILTDLIDKLQTIILPDTPFEIDYAWTGIMAFGSDKFPIVRKHSPHIFLGVRLGGMGVAMGSEVGERLAEMMIQGLT